MRKDFKRIDNENEREKKAVRKALKVKDKKQQPAQSANLDRLQECNVCGCHKLRNNSKLKSQLSQAYYPY